MDEQELSGSGHPVHRHEHVVEGAGSAGDGALIDAITAHVERHLGPVGTVWHQRESPWVHIDVHVAEPTGDRPYRSLVTSGMSEQPMAVPEDEDHDLRYAELMLALPAAWELSSDWDEERDWPVRLLQNLAEFPHAFATHLWSGHTVPNLDPPEPYADGTELCGALVAPAVGVPDEFRVLRHDGRDIHFLAVVPLHADEMQLKLDRGLDELYELFDRHGVSELLEADRPSVVGRRRRFGRRR